MNSFYCCLFVVLIALTSQANAACLKGKLKNATIVDDNGNTIVESYCLYSNEKHAVNTEWVYSYPTCLSCTCTTVLSCCGYGRGISDYPVPEGCRFADGTCDVLVKINDPSQRC